MDSNIKLPKELAEKLASSGAIAKQNDEALLKVELQILRLQVTQSQLQSSKGMQIAYRQGQIDEFLRNKGKSSEKATISPDGKELIINE